MQNLSQTGYLSGVTSLSRDRRKETEITSYICHRRLGLCPLRDKQTTDFGLYPGRSHYSKSLGSLRDHDEDSLGSRMNLSGKLVDRERGTVPTP